MLQRWKNFGCKTLEQIMTRSMNFTIEYPFSLSIPPCSRQKERELVCGRASEELLTKANLDRAESHTLPVTLEYEEEQKPDFIHSRSTVLSLHIWIADHSTWAICCHQSHLFSSGCRVGFLVPRGPRPTEAHFSTPITASLRSSLAAVTTLLLPMPLQARISRLARN